jgi:integrase
LYTKPKDSRSGYQRAMARENPSGSPITQPNRDRCRSKRRGRPLQGSTRAPARAATPSAVVRKELRRSQSDFLPAGRRILFARSSGRTRCRAHAEGRTTGVSLHSLRHSHASILLSNGVPVAVVSQRLGHADQNITLSIYSHALPADTLAAAKIWNDSMADVIADARRKRLSSAPAGPVRRTRTA